MQKPEVDNDVFVTVQRQRVWEAITSPEELGQWYAPGCRWEILDLQIGGTVKFYNTDTEILLATIQELEPPRKFVLRWQPEPSAPSTSLTNTFLLEEVSEGTRVTISQTGYESLPDDIRQQRIDEDVGAFTAIAESLKAYTEAA